MAEISSKELKKLVKEFNGEIVSEKDAGINNWTDVDKLVYKKIKEKDGSK
mgnify:CR=1 FL=1|jgi:hypothetical protein|tara:strand:+ start:23593 stop:23742 length:150 start_codon:yes stop_codon:yes gene_type:complete